MEIDVTRFIETECMRDYSASAAEFGVDTGSATWRASMEALEDWNFLPTSDNLQEFREFVISSGGWSEEEVSEMTDEHLQALCLQWIAGDWRECFDRPEHAAGINWSHYQSMAEAGTVPSSFYRADDGQIYWSMSH